MAYVSITVSVPEERVGELLSYAAGLALAVAVQPSAPIQAPRDDPNERLAEAYLGGISDYWRPFLDYLADRPDQWVPWSDLCTHIELSAQQASGMLGAAERRCGKPLPYEKKWKRRVRYFYMPASIAEELRRLRDLSPVT